MQHLATTSIAGGVKQGMQSQILQITAMQHTALRSIAGGVKSCLQIKKLQI